MVELLVTVIPPVTLPVADGVKVTLSVPACPDARICPEARPLMLKPGPEYATPEIVTLEFPELVNVTFCVLLLPTLTLPKPRLVGLTVSKSVEALTVSVAALLVTLPAELLTITVNCAPLSEVAVAGVM